MPETASIASSERLPWLSDTPSPKPPAVERRRVAKSGPHGLAGWAFAGVLLLAGSSYWLGTQAGRGPDSIQTETTGPAQPEATLRLPGAVATDEPEVALPAAPEVRPSPAPLVSIPRDVARPARQNRRSRLTREEPPRDSIEQTYKSQAAEVGEPSKETKPAAAEAAPEKAKAQPVKLWPSREVKGAAGRLVQIGAFGTRQQAKLGWRRMQRSYPAVGRLPAVVVESRNSRGRKFYRFQIGTTSQAHSEILCQRMQRIDFSCAVLGLPWKSKVER